MKRTLAALLLCLTPALFGFDSTDPPSEEEMRQKAETRFEEIKERLELTEAQTEAARPIIEESFAKRRAILESRGLKRGEGGQQQRPDDEQMRAMRAEILKARHDSDVALAKILSTEQMAELQKIREEARKEMREKMRDRRGMP